MSPDPLSRGTSPNSESSHPSENPDVSTWLTKQQAADVIRVSTKTIEQFAKDGKIQQAVWRPQNRGAARAVYHPDDVARIAQERSPGPTAFVLPAGVTSPVHRNGHEPAATALSRKGDTPTGEDLLRLVFTAALQRLTSENPPTSENSEKLFLTLDQAAQVSGLSRTALRNMIAHGMLQAVKDRGWKIRRRDLEAL